MKKPYTMTVEDFRELVWEHLRDLPDSDLIYFADGELSFYRVKQRGDHMHQIAFNQLLTVTHDPESEPQS
jgi:hypothetical protein